MIKIVTDSTVYLKKRDAAELNLKIVPMNYTVNGKPFFESYSDGNGNFEELLKSSSQAATSQPNPASFLSAFEDELSQGNEILCITISSRLSGTYSSAYIAAKQTESKNILVFDSQSTAGGLYLMILEADKLIRSGCTLPELKKELTKVRDRIVVSFSVDDMTPLRNSGRIGFVRLSVGTILNIKPILLCQDGVVVSDSVAHGNNEIIKKLVEKIPENAQEAVINYISNNRAASNLYGVIREKFPELKIKLCKMGPVLGIHLGLQVVAVSFITKE